MDDNIPASGEILDEVQTLQELPDILENLDMLNAEQAQEVELARRQNVESFAEDSNVAVLRTDIPARVRVGSAAYDEAIRQGVARLDAGYIGEAGLEELKAKEAQKRDAAFLREEGFVRQNAETIKARYGMGPMPAASPELLAEVQTGFVAMREKTGRQVFTEIRELFDAARGGSLAPKEQVRVHQLLHRYALPVAERMGTQPPRHSKAWQPAFQKLLPLIRTHLDLYRGGPMSRLAEDFMDQYTQQFNWARKMIQEHGWDDLILSTGCPLLWPKKEG